MLRERRQRFERLLRLRQREVDQQLAKLALARASQLESRMAMEHAQTALRNAALAYRIAPGQSRNAAELIEAGAWLQDRVKLVERALLAQEKANERVRLANLGVQKAEIAKRQIETLLERLKLEEVQAQNRREQIDQDEIATRLATYGH